MATASRRISRKELRQPDWFQIASDNALEWYAAHKAVVFAAAGALILVLALALGWQAFKERQNAEASQQFSAALALYQSEKFREAVPALEKVKTYRWSRYAVLAHLYLANSYLAIDDLEKALSEAQRSLTATRPNTLYRQIALYTLATVEERRKDCKSAIDHYDQAQKIPEAFQVSAALGKARCAEQLGDTKTAIAAYKDFLKENPASSYALRLAELEAKWPESAIPTKP
ncbi:MAG TPA: tetratricopeptide repeat protein [Candidatus Binatia bacterium]|nr:tetratricopeptide repeat protein [Candidatus Binatia bacterium]